MEEFRTVRECYETCKYGDHLEKESIGEIMLQGWVRTNRDNGSVGFIEFNDGTFFKNAQLVYVKNECEDFDAISHIGTGSAITVLGKFVLTPVAKQPFEIQVKKISIEGTVDADYPLQKKRHSFEFLREIAHLRPRTNTFTALYRVRSVLSMAIHEFFQSQGFIYVHTPILTGNDAEGAGESFKVVTDLKHPEEFFSKEASLTVSGQLHAEAFALAFRDVYTFGPTFRAEKSNTPRHACEFWMIEPEIAFADLEDDMDLIEDCLKFAIKYVLDNCEEEMEFFNKMIAPGIIDRLEAIVASHFKRMTYTEAIDLLIKAQENGHKFEYNKIFWGMDLQSEHERYLAETIVNGPMFLTDYPKDIKAFYMRQNDDGKTVAACDLLVPGVGELVGGSQREERYDLLKARMDELGMTAETLSWYMDLRRYGGCKHAGFGIGFDRLLMYITGVTNIRDSEPFPRTFNNLKY
jgi:asparaginyl-tRNA synthetase